MVSKAHGSRTEPIETASRDELSALQLQRLRWLLSTLMTMWHHFVPNAAIGVHPEDVKSLEDLETVSVHHQVRFTRALPVWFVCDTAQGCRAYPRFQRYYRMPDRGWLYPERYQYLGRYRGAFGVRSGRAQGDIVHIAYGYGLFTGGTHIMVLERLGCTVVPMSVAKPKSRCSLSVIFSPTSSW
jgi:phenylacetate-CoA ligase